MQFRYVDAHCHLQFDDYSADAEKLIARMREESVVGIVVGTDYESSQKAVALAEQHEHLFASVGLHPNCVADEIFDEEKYRALAQNPKVVAIGECGLDYFRNKTEKRAQQESLRAQIALADELNKPLIIHCRPSKGTNDAYHDLIAILKETGGRGDVHFFVGGISEAKQLIALGFTVSFTAVITFTHDYDQVIKSLPIRSILSETDAPYVAPASHRGSRNDPLAVIDIVRQIATIRDEDTEVIRQALFANASRIFPQVAAAQNP